MCHSTQQDDELKIAQLRKELEIGIEAFRNRNGIEISTREELDQFFEDIMSENSSSQ